MFKIFGSGASTWARLTALGLVAILPLATASAQTKGKASNGSPPAKEAAPVPAPAAPAAKPAAPRPDVTVMTLLVQTHMAALSHALVTGNFSVLFALGSPDFQKLNSPQKLAEMFAQFRLKQIDIRPTILYQPILTGQPSTNAKGLLRLTGYYTTQPQQVMFDMLFQPVAGAWQLYGISVGTQAPKQAAGHPAPEPAKATKEPEEKTSKKSKK